MTEEKGKSATFQLGVDCVKCNNKAVLFQITLNWFLIDRYDEFIKNMVCVRVLDRNRWTVNNENTQ